MGKVKIYVNVGRKGFFIVENEGERDFLPDGWRPEED